MVYLFDMYAFYVEIIYKHIIVNIYSFHFNTHFLNYKH
jgi:hypothetical protein